MARYLARPCPRCNGYLGIVLREAGPNVWVRAVNGHCVKCDYRLAWILIRGKRAAAQILSGGNMLDPQKTLEREALLRRHRELQAEIAQHERNLRDGEARLPMEEQLRLNVRRLLAGEIPDLAGQGSDRDHP